jgi:hypothetical protein
VAKRDSSTGITPFHMKQMEDAVSSGSRCSTNNGAQLVGDAPLLTVFLDCNCSAARSTIPEWLGCMHLVHAFVHVEFVTT